MANSGACHVHACLEKAACGERLRGDHAAKRGAVAAIEIQPCGAWNVNIRRGWNVAAGTRRLAPNRSETAGSKICEPRNEQRGDVGCNRDAVRVCHSED